MCAQKGIEASKAGKWELTLTRYKGNPLIIPLEDNWWESEQTFNPGVMTVGDQVHILYRAIGRDYVSRLGYARSRNGLRIDERSREPVYQHRLPTSNLLQMMSPSGGGFVGSEDPRVVVIGDTVYMTYTLYDGYNIRVAINSISLEDFLGKEWRWGRPHVISPEGEKHKNWMLFPKKFEGKFAILHSLSPRVQIAFVEDFEGVVIRSKFDGGYGMGRRERWDAVIRGAAAPPIETKDGWLLLYHGSPVREIGGYRLGAMLLDLVDPTTVIGRHNTPLLVPEEWYEWCGFKPGVIYATGAVVLKGRLLVYYGASDSYVCLAEIGLDELLSNITRK
ncbi:MAG: hypothetical protein NZ920_01385 [Aigarchaeota archaeon]|nr:hypothetical protein [Aigarchaeota archaeon]MDW8093094.1 hypothetical protein [Nitrososphaerota archaeon]